MDARVVRPFIRLNDLPHEACDDATSLRLHETAGKNTSVIGNLNEIDARCKVGNRESEARRCGCIDVLHQPSVEVEELSPLQTVALQGDHIAVGGQLEA